VIRTSLVIPRRFNGPPRSGNGGYVCGRLASHLAGPVRVRLRAPPPLERELAVEATDDEARLLDGDVLVAEAHRCELDLRAAATPGFAEAEAAWRRYPGFLHHPLPGCFVCGPQRAAGDGLRIFPGPIEADESVFAAPWVPAASLADTSGCVATEFLWAALDCAGAFALKPSNDELMLLGELSARIDRSVRPGERCIVVAWPIAIDGRKRFAGTAIVSDAGDSIAVARATWIVVGSLDR
jgi:hypothetical protein